MSRRTAGDGEAEGLEAPPLVLVDGSSYLFRAYHAMPELSTADGMPTGAIFGVINMLKKLSKDYPDSPIAVVFDAKGKTFRDEIYAEYKANRPPMPDDLRRQIEPIHEIVRALGLPLLVEPGVEADDVIGTLAGQATEDRRRVIISTMDKDLAQLVSEYVTLVNTMTDTAMDTAAVSEKFGVPPERIVDYLALVGDSSDNIPGVPKVGAKTAAKLLREHGDLDTLIEHADEVGGKVGENLRSHLEQLALSRQLARIKCDVPLALTLAELRPGEPDEAALLEHYTRLEFQRWLEELGGSLGEAPSPETDYECITTAADLDRWLELLANADLVAVDTETTSLDYMRAELVGFSFAVASPGTTAAAYLPVGHDYVGAPDQLSLTAAVDALKPLLEDPELPKVGQNLKYDMSVLARYGVALAGVRYDTMLESYVVNSVASRHNMDDLAQTYLGRSTIKYEDVAGKGARQLAFDQVPVEQATAYAAEDAEITLALHETLWPKLEAEPSLRTVFETIEMPLVPILSRIERHGTLVDGGLLEEQSRELGERLDELKARCYDLAGEEFNVDSTKQLQRIFYDKLGLPVLRKTPKGQPSTAEPVLQDLAQDYELPQVILDYRGLAKLKSTYTDKLPLQINQRTGRIHTSYHQAVAATGRLSSSDPNLQNIPIRSAAGRRIRQAFVAPRGMRIVAADYSQIELRIMAHLSGDKGLNDAFAANEDIHRATAAEVFGLGLDEVTDEQRRSAKAINFGLIYGMSAFGLGRQLGISRTLAQEYIDRYFERYPGVLKYMDDTRARGRERGYVETVFGRRLYLPEIDSGNPARRQGAERTAINAPMQGTAADIIKRAMITVTEWLDGTELNAAMIMQVHDELVFEVHHKEVEDLIAGVVERMEAAAELTVPLLVEAGVGTNWDEAH